MATKTFKYQGEEFVVTEPDKGCYSEVTLPGFDGKIYVGVNSSYPENGKFAWTGEASYTSEQGITIPSGYSADLNTALQMACRALLEDQKTQEARDAFNPKAACDDLRDFVDKLPTLS